MKFIKDKLPTDNVILCQKNDTHITVYCAKHKPFDIWSAYVHTIFSDFQESEYITEDIDDESSHIVLTISWKHWTGSKVDKNGKPYMNTSIIDWEFMGEDS